MRAHERLLLSVGSDKFTDEFKKVLLELDVPLKEFSEISDIRITSYNVCYTKLLRATGARTFTATSSQGLALMHEVLFTAAGMRVPVVMMNANRALSAPINIWNDQQDSLSQRDTGWIQLYAEDNQEVLDLVIQAFKIAEDEKVLLPVMVNLDGFILTHTVEPVILPKQESVLDFIGTYEPKHAYLDPKKPMTQGALGDPNYYMETIV